MKTEEEKINEIFKYAFMYTYNELTERAKTWGVESVEERLKLAETKQNKRTAELLWNFNINASVKTNPKSLPYTHKISIVQKFNSYVNSVFFIEPLYRKILPQLIEDNLFKIRFFIDYQPHYNKEKPELIDGLEISFCYYKHKRQ